MPVSAIFENIEAGAGIHDIMEWFEGLDREQVKAVIVFSLNMTSRQRWAFRASTDESQ